MKYSGLEIQCVFAVGITFTPLCSMRSFPSLVEGIVYFFWAIFCLCGSLAPRHRRSVSPRREKLEKPFPDHSDSRMEKVFDIHSPGLYHRTDRCHCHGRYSLLHSGVQVVQPDQMSILWPRVDEVFINLPSEDCSIWSRSLEVWDRCNCQAISVRFNFASLR